VAYWDTSCLVKLYVPEADSPVIRAHLVPGVSVVTSEISRLELWATLRRKEAIGDLLAGGARRAITVFDGDVAAGLIIVEEISAVVVTRYETVVDHCLGRTPPIPLRTLDAIHLSTALACGESEVVAADRRMRDAALILGLSIFPPP
jgi:predicted nucleic acid-binding protein